MSIRPGKRVRAGERKLEMASPFPGEPGLLILPEAPFADTARLAVELNEGLYPRPFVLEHDGLRSLYFGSLRFQQSAMRIAAPHALDIAYTQGMMAFLLFNPRPRRLTLLGLGGGSLAKFCHRHLPATDITVVELDQDVIGFRDIFCVPPDDERFRIVHDDAIDHVAASTERADVLLVDLFDQDGVVAGLATSAFYDDAFRMLTGSGLLVMNLAGDKDACSEHVARVSAVFADRVIAMSLREDGNYLLFAFRNPEFAPRWKWMTSIARELQARVGLDLPSFARLLERGQTLRLAQRMLSRA